MARVWSRATARNWISWPRKTRSISGQPIWAARTRRNPPVRLNANPFFEIVGDAKITTRDESNSDLTVEIRPSVIQGIKNSIVVEIGGKVFGLSDSPLRWNAGRNILTVTIPTALIATQRSIRLVPLMWRRDRVRSAAITGIDEHAGADKIQLLSQDGDKVRFLLTGSRLAAARILEPPNIVSAPVGNPAADPESLRVLELTKAQIEAFKGVLLRKGNERPILLAIPAVDFKPAKKPEVKAKFRARQAVHEFQLHRRRRCVRSEGSDDAGVFPIEGSWVRLQRFRLRSSSLSPARGPAVSR